MARPTKLTADLQRRMIEALTGGAPFEDACRYAGVAPATAYRWMIAGIPPGDAGHQPDCSPRPGPRYREFREAVQTAQSSAVVRAVAMVSSAMQTNWRAAAWYLERRRPEEFGRRIAIDGGNTPHVVEHRIVIPDDLDRAAAVAAALEEAGVTPLVALAALEEDDVVDEALEA